MPSDELAGAPSWIMDRALYWTKGGEYTTVATVGPLDSGLPYEKATTYGTFKEKIGGMLGLVSSRDVLSHVCSSRLHVVPHVQGLADLRGVSFHL